MVAGPPVEMQVSVSWSESYVTSPDIEMSPTDQMVNHDLLDKYFEAQKFDL